MKILKVFFIAIIMLVQHSIANDIEVTQEMKELERDFIAQKFSKVTPKLELHCDNNIGRACSFLGNMYSDDRANLKDITKAFHYFDKACQLGDFIGCSRSGDIAANEYKDYQQALKLYNYSCYKIKDGSSCLKAESLYSNGLIKIEIEEEISLKIKYLKQGCEDRYEVACSMAGTFFNKIGKRNEAKKYDTKACEINKVYCQYLQQYEK